MSGADEAVQHRAAGGRYSALNRRFHGWMLAAANQPTLAKFINVTPYPLVMRQVPGTSVAASAGGLARGAHTAIYAALRVRNAVAARGDDEVHVSSPGTP